MCGYPGADLPPLTRQRDKIMTAVDSLDDSASRPLEEAPCDDNFLARFQQWRLFSSTGRANFASDLPSAAEANCGISGRLADSTTIVLRLAFHPAVPWETT